jgi:hypothetical protein
VSHFVTEGERHSLKQTYVCNCSDLNNALETRTIILVIFTDVDSVDFPEMIFGFALTGGKRAIHAEFNICNSNCMHINC